MVHLAELHSTPYELAHPNWAMPHPTELRCTLLSYAEPYWATLYPIDLRCTLLSYAVPTYWATQHYVSYTTASWVTYSARTFVQLCQMPEYRIIRYRNKGTPVLSGTSTREYLVGDRDQGTFRERLEVGNEESGTYVQCSLFFCFYFTVLKIQYIYLIKHCTQSKHIKTSAV